MESAPSAAPCSPAYDGSGPKTPEIAPAFCLECKLHPCECKASKKQKVELVKEEEPAPASQDVMTLQQSIKDLIFERLRNHPEWLAEYLEKEVQIKSGTIDHGHLTLDLRVSDGVSDGQILWVAPVHKGGKLTKSFSER